MSLLHVTRRLLPVLPLVFVTLYEGEHEHVVRAHTDGDSIVVINGHWKTTPRRYGDTAPGRLPDTDIDVFVPCIDERAGAALRYSWRDSNVYMDIGDFQLLNAYEDGDGDIAILWRHTKLPHGKGMVAHVPGAMFEGLMTLPYWYETRRELRVSSASSRRERTSSWKEGAGGRRRYTTCEHGTSWRVQGKTWSGPWCPGRPSGSSRHRAMRSIRQ